MDRRRAVKRSVRGGRGSYAEIKNRGKRPNKKGKEIRKKNETRKNFAKLGEDLRQERREMRRILGDTAASQEKRWHCERKMSKN